VENKLRMLVFSFPFFLCLFYANGMCAYTTMNWWWWWWLREYAGYWYYSI